MGDSFNGRTGFGYNSRCTILIEGEADHIWVLRLASMHPSYGIDQSGIRRPPNQRKRIMPYVVTEACINCKHTTCVEVCPSDAFREGPNFMVIEPDDCVDCNLCPAECPVGAIYESDKVPEEQRPFIALNAELARQWPTVYQQTQPLAEHEQWDGVPNKLALLIR